MKHCWHDTDGAYQTEICCFCGEKRTTLHRTEQRLIKGHGKHVTSPLSVYDPPTIADDAVCLKRTPAAVKASLKHTASVSLWIHKGGFTSTGIINRMNRTQPHVT